MRAWLPIWGTWRGEHSGRGELGVHASHWLLGGGTPAALTLQSLPCSSARSPLVVAPSAGQVYLLDRRFLDPRRPIIAPGAKPTPQQAAEGLPPYQPELPFAG